MLYYGDRCLITKAEAVILKHRVTLPPTNRRRALLLLVVDDAKAESE